MYMGAAVYMLCVFLRFGVYVRRLCVFEGKINIITRFVYEIQNNSITIETREKERFKWEGLGRWM